MNKWVVGLMLVMFGMLLGHILTAIEKPCEHAAPVVSTAQAMPAVVQETPKTPAVVLVTDEEVRKSGYWHRAIYNNVEHTIYTGPGQVMTTRYVEVKKPPLNDMSKKPDAETKK